MTSTVSRSGPVEGEPTDADPSSAETAETAEPTDTDPSATLASDAADLLEARSLLERFSSTFEARSYSGADALRLVSVTKDIENIAAAIRLQASVRVEETREHESTGHPDPASLISEVTGEPVGKERSSLEVAKTASSHPDISEALKKGELTESQLKEVTSAAEVNPEKAAELVETAKQKTAGELREACRKVKSKALSGADSAERHEKMRKERFFKTWVDIDGFGHLQAKLMADQLAILRSALDPFREEIREQARKNEDYESYEQYSADALIEMAKAAATGGSSKASQALIRLRIDLEAYVRGYTQDGEISEVMGTGAVPVSVISEYAQNAIFELIALKGTKVDTIVTDSRHIPKVVRIALEEAGTVCSHEGCNIRYPLQIDHMEEVRYGGLTELRNLTFVCPKHHYLKTVRKWTWEGPPGHRRLVPPESPEPPDYESFEDRSPDDGPPD
ncbi:MAG: DUF222 domain-containing protein, partial [Acidimicrobiales bacterium]